MILHVLIVLVAGWLQRHQQQVITYLLAENRVLKAQLGGRQRCLTETERRRLTVLAHPLGRKRLQEVATLVTPDTLLRWYRRLIAQKFDGSTRRTQLGRPRVAEEIEQLVVRMVGDNPTWGYRRIQGALANLGQSIDKLTVRNILRRHHMDPAPQRRKGGIGWTQFLKMHWEVLAATDFFTVEVATWHGLVTYYVLVVMELTTRRVQIAGITPHPTAAFMQHCARQLTDPCEGFLLGKRYLLHDRDTKFTQAFDRLLKASGVESVLLPPRSPHVNAYCERFVRSITEEALARSGEASRLPRRVAALLLSRRGVTRATVGARSNMEANDECTGSLRTDDQNLARIRALTTGSINSERYPAPVRGRCERELDRGRLAGIYPGELGVYRSAFRGRGACLTPASVRVIGHLSARDWEGVQACLLRAFALPDFTAL